MNSIQQDDRPDSPPLLFTRDRFTWLAYAMLAYYAYLQAGLGPLMPFLRQELGLSYTLGGLHLSAFALGMFSAGVTGAALAARFGRRLLFWGGAAGMAGGALLLVMRSPPERDPGCGLDHGLSRHSVADHGAGHPV